ncbi:uncharacterized protein LOC122056191 [Zingiber officinale]|uniref:Phosphatidylinositol-specific phospholipase C X domain-containing protein n=1 Tax=Zingiber officinale TaxID=94328 RepID=A0A8J5LGY5_ZINOF|nr:uncharacterized protein LOC122056191 [Zingiber officinale]KAG6517865.1 hypothetical protein ZIOFF_021264 [Zingiber officinale]
MGAQCSRQVHRRKALASEKRALLDLLESSGTEFPGSDHRPVDRKAWMSALGPGELRLNQIVWPGTHDSATDCIGIPCITRPFAQCQSSSIYRQLCLGARLLDVRVQKDRRVCHGPLVSYPVDRVLDAVKRFLEETEHELVVLELRTEFGHEDPPDFDKFLVDNLGDLLIPYDDAIFANTIAEVLPGRVLCVWKPRKAAAPGAGSPLWGPGCLIDHWVDTDLPMTKFENNMRRLGEQKAVTERRHLYRVENTATPQADNPVVCVRPVTRRIRGYARLFIAQAFQKGIADRLQVLSTDFIDVDFVDACVGLTLARIQGKAA